MKQWIMPQVKVEKFVANEYVAECQAYIRPSTTKGSIYVDLNKDLKWNEGNENTAPATNSDGNLYYPNHWGAAVQPGWYYNVEIWKTPSGRSTITGYVNGTPYRDIKLYSSGSDLPLTLVGEFNVYVVSSQSMYIYNLDGTPSQEPTVVKSFS